MIIWIDGTTGVGKTHVSDKLAEYLTDKNAEHIDSDLYWEEFQRELQNPLLIAFSGFNPYCNKRFLDYLRKYMDDKLNMFQKTLVISMSLVDIKCKEELLEYYEEKNIPSLHFILEAKMDTIKSRIGHDLHRSIEAQNQQKANVAWQIDFLEKNYDDAIRINTEDKGLDEIIREILTYL